MARTPLASSLRDAASVVAESVERDVSTDEVIAERTARLTRREVVDAVR